MIHQPRLRCVEFVEQVTDWMEASLTERECVLVEEHMVVCPHCNELAQQMRTTVTALRQLDRDAPVRAPEAARAALLEIFRQERSSRNSSQPDQP